MEKNVVVFAHKFLTQPDDDLVIYLNKQQASNVMHILHSFPDAKDRKSKLFHYKKGNQVISKESPDFMGFPEPLIYLKEMLYTLFWVYSSKIKWDLYVGMDGLGVLFGLILKKTGSVKKVVYWAMDFVPENRFSGILGKLKNTIYHRINMLGYTHADEMWDISPRMAEAREEYLTIPQNIYKNKKLVPYGVWTNRITKINYDLCEKNTLVFMGHLLEKQGVQIVIKAIPEIIKDIPDFKFKIIGTGRYEKELKNLTEQLGVSSYCVFTGKIESDVELENEIAKSAAAIAPYIKELDTWTYYADPGKVKKYLACGVPVLLTDVPWNALDITNKECGLIITTDSYSITQGIKTIFDPVRNQHFRNNAIEYAKSYDYEVIFDSLVKSI